MDAAEFLLFSTDYPHWTFDDPEWVRKRLPGATKDRIMAGNAINLFGLPSEVDAVDSPA
jgi:predicted TIM-barrel fold metal-dependent hydrolase